MSQTVNCRKLAGIEFWFQMERRQKRVIPEQLQKLAVASAKYFGSREDAIVMNFMVKYDCLEEQQMEKLFGFTPTLLKAQLSNLLAERLLLKRMKQVTTVEGKLKDIVYYFVNHASLVDIVQYKLHKMRSLLEEEQRKTQWNYGHLFQCAKCTRSYSEYEARMLFQPAQNAYFCRYCHEPLGETTVNAIASSKLLIQFHEFTNPLLKLLEEASGLYVDQEPEPDLLGEVLVCIETEKNPVKVAKERTREENSAQQKNSANLPACGVSDAIKIEGPCINSNGGCEDKLQSNTSVSVSKFSNQDSVDNLLTAFQITPLEESVGVMSDSDSD